MKQGQLQVRSLKIGSPLSTDLTDGAGVLLLRAGVVITEHFINRLIARGVKTVTTREAQDGPRCDQAAPDGTEAEAGQRLADEGHEGPATFESELSYIPPRSPVGRLSPVELHRMTQQARHRFDDALGRYMTVGPAFVQGGIDDLGFASSLLSGFRDMASADPALVLMLLRLRDTAGDDVYSHSIKSALLTMTLCQGMGFTEKQVSDAGVAALVHDLGMLRVPAAIRSARRKLAHDEWRQVREHPTHTLNILDRTHGVSESIKTAAYQVHERCDASGYPRQRHRQFIHPAAKVIALADSYCALTADRPHRPALSGHEAMKVILRETAAGRFDKAVARAILDTLSLFPVGSLVGLSDGRTARVIRGVPGESVKPVVAVIKDGTPVDWELDLAKVGDLTITRLLSEDAVAA